MFGPRVRCLSWPGKRSGHPVPLGNLRRRGSRAPFPLRQPSLPHRAQVRYIGQRKGEMEDIQEQLAALRRRIARVDRKYAAPTPPPNGGPSGAPPRVRRVYPGPHEWRGGPHPARRALRNREALGAPPPPRQHGHFRPRRAAGRPAGAAFRWRHRRARIPPAGPSSIPKPPDSRAAPGPTRF